MNFEGITYRPPIEADSMLLQVTVGCAHNKCTYCNMYDDVKFRLIDINQIEKDLQEARLLYKNVERIFLVNGDAFVLSAKKLNIIAKLIHHYFPECNTITMYASIRNIQSKTDEELIELKRNGINDLWVGVESGWNEVVVNIKKGYTAEDAKKQLKRLNEIGINHMAGLMLGVAGQNKGLKNAEYTASFLNETQPKLIWAGTLGLFEGTPMTEDAKNGVFTPASELEILEEEMALISKINLLNIPFYGIHPTNSLPVSGIIPADKEKMIDIIVKGINKLGFETLSNHFKRNTL